MCAAAARANQIIEEVNFAANGARQARGPEPAAQGTGTNLKPLRHLQRRRRGARAKEIEAVVDSVQAQRHRVLVVESGKFGASHALYDFSEPDRKYAVTRRKMKNTGLPPRR